MRLGEKLLALGMISPDQQQVALVEQKNTKKLFGAILVEMGFITESALGEVLAESSGTAKFDSKATMLDSTVVRRIPKEIASRHKVIAVSYENDVLQLAMADVYNVLAIDQVRRHVPRNTKIVPIFCTDSEILELIDQYYDYEISVDGILKEIETGIRENTKLDGRAGRLCQPDGATGERAAGGCHQSHRIGHPFRAGRFVPAPALPYRRRDDPDAFVPSGLLVGDGGAY